MTVCGYEDSLSGAKCTLRKGHGTGVYHADRSDPDIELTFRSCDVTLILPEVPDFDDDDVISLL
jgi:hypothetical protein